MLLLLLLLLLLEGAVAERRRGRRREAEVAGGRVGRRRRRRRRDVDEPAAGVELAGAGARRGVDGRRRAVPRLLRLLTVAMKMMQDVVRTNGARWRPVAQQTLLAAINRDCMSHTVLAEREGVVKTRRKFRSTFYSVDLSSQLRAKTI